MKMPTGSGRRSSITRRDMLRLVPLGAAACWAGCAQSQGADFRFIVVNDLHHASSACDPFFGRLVAEMASQGAVDFCLIVGDIADTGRPESFAAVTRAFAGLGVPIYTVPGNHDNDVDKTSRLYTEAFPGRLNYTFVHEGWQFIGLDSTEGNQWQNTRVSDTTLTWLDRTLPALDRTSPTVLFTHFPLAADVNFAPLNAGDVLARVAPLNLRGVFSGHYHARVERQVGTTPVLTNACCSRVRDNHDGSLEEGYLLCTGHADGRLTRTFVEFVAARKATA